MAEFDNEIELLGGTQVAPAELRERRESAAQTSPQQGETGGFRQGAANVLESVLPFVGMPERIEQNRPQGGYGAVDQNLLGAAKGFTFGLMGTIGAGGEELVERVRGTDDQTFGERRAEYNQAINEESGVIGEIVGSIAGTPRLAFNAADDAIRSIPKIRDLLATRGMSGTAARMTEAGLLGAGEAALYKLAEGGDLDDAEGAAVFGAIAGPAGQLGVETIGAIVKALGPVFGTGADIRTSEQLVQLLDDAYGGAFTTRALGQNNIDADAVLLAMQDTGRMDATLQEIFPDALRQTLRTLSGTQKQNVAAATRGLMDHMENMRNVALPEFQQAVGQALGSANIRTSQEIVNEGRALRETLQGEYEAALRNVPRFPSGRVRGIPVRDVRRVMEGAFRGAKGGVPEAARDRLVSLLPSDMRGRRLNEFTPRQLLELRQSLDSVIYSGQFPASRGFDSTSSIDRTVLRNYLTPARNAVNELLLNAAPDLRRVDAQYGSEISLRHAYDAGRDAFKSPEGTAIYDSFAMRANRSPAEVANFVEGVKAQLMKETENITGAVALRNYLTRADQNGRFDLIRQVAGPDVATEIINQASRYAMVNDLTRGLNKEMPSIPIEQSTNTAALGDLALMAGAVGNQLSTAIGAGAARRQLAAAGNRGTGAAAQAGVLNDLLQMPANQAAQAVNQNLMEGVPRLFPLIPSFGAADQ